MMLSNCYVNNYSEALDGIYDSKKETISGFIVNVHVGRLGTILLNVYAY